MPSGEVHSFKQNVADTICDELAKGRSLRSVCRDDGMPPESTVRQWALDDREGFAAQYARAREIGYHSMADELLEIADDGRNDYTSGEEPVLNGEHIQRSRLRVDTRKWMLSKVLPKVYGDKLDVTSDGEKLEFPSISVSFEKPD